ncbi:hypothetical protein ACFL6C_14260 [Myxococcota bacterium]
MTHVGAQPLWTHPLLEKVDSTKRVVNTNDEHDPATNPSTETLAQPRQPEIRHHRVSLTTLAGAAISGELTSTLSPRALADLAQVAAAFTAALEQPTAANTQNLTNTWTEFVRQELRLGTADVDQLMLELKRQACLDKQDNLDDHADRIRLNREIRRRARLEVIRGRQILAQQGAGGPDAVLDSAFEPAGTNAAAIANDLMTQADTDHSHGVAGTVQPPAETANTVHTTGTEIPVADADGDVFLMPPGVYHDHGVEEAIDILNETATTQVTVNDLGEESVPVVEDPYAIASCRAGKCNPTNLTDAPHLKLAIHAILAQGIRSPEAVVKALEEQFGIKATVTTVDFDGTPRKAIDLGNRKLFCDGNGNGLLDVSDYNFKAALGDIEAQYGVTADVFAQMAPKFINDMLEKMEAAFSNSNNDGSTFPRDQLARIFALAFVLSADEMILTKGQLEDYVNGLEEQLRELSESSDTTAEDLQKAMYEQQVILLKAGDLFHVLHKAANEVAEEEQPKGDGKVEAEGEVNAVGIVPGGMLGQISSSQQ